MKRTVEAAFAAGGLLTASPVLLPVVYFVWKQDGHSPFYIARRVGKDGVVFDMMKLRSMVVGADRSGVDSTATTDSRITPVGAFIRRYKLDEVTQLWNVLKGDMSLVGPRPNVKRETDLYTEVELGLLAVSPGITDFASIVFSDEGDILAGRHDPDVTYHQLIRPGKSRLGLFYIDHQSFGLDVRLVGLTLIAIASRPRALRGVVKLLRKLGADEQLLTIAAREHELVPMPPPGSATVVTTRDQRVPDGKGEAAMAAGGG